jgi:predicted nucleic acid-binding protein
VRPQLQTLLQQATFIVPYFSWRPSSNDPGDEHVIECALNARAALVTFNLRDFRTARHMYKLPVLTPAQFLTDYLNQEE